MRRLTLLTSRLRVSTEDQDVTGQVPADEATDPNATNTEVSTVVTDTPPTEVTEVSKEEAASKETPVATDTPESKSEEETPADDDTNKSDDVVATPVEDTSTEPAPVDDVASAAIAAQAEAPVEEVKPEELMEDTNEVPAVEPVTEEPKTEEPAASTPVETPTEEIPSVDAPVEEDPASNVETTDEIENAPAPVVTEEVPATTTEPETKPTEETVPDESSPTEDTTADPKAEPTAKDPVEDSDEDDEKDMSLEDSLVALAEGATDAEIENMATSEAIDVAAALESIAIDLQDTLSDGGLNKQSAHLVNSHVSYLLKRVGFNETKRNAVSLEEFGSNSNLLSRRDSTANIMVTIREKVVQIWKAIIAAIKRTIEWLKRRYESIFKSTEAIYDRAMRINKKIHQSQEKPATVVTFTSMTALTTSVYSMYRQAQFLTHEATVPADLVERANTVASIAKDILVYASRNNLFIGKAIAEALEKSDSTALNGLGHMFAHPVMSMKELSHPGKEGFEEPQPGIRLSRSEELLGGKALVSYSPDPSSYTPKHLQFCRTFISAFNPHRFNISFANPVKSVRILTLSDCTQVVNAVIRTMQAVQTYKRDLDTLEHTKEKIVAAAAKWTDNVVHSSGVVPMEDNRRDLQHIAANVPRLLDQPTESFSTYALTTSNALLNYVSGCLRYHNAT